MGFSSFIVLGGMRTGSNLLETYLNQFPDIDCYGELFNPHFIISPEHDDFCGITLDQRVKNPQLALRTVHENTPGLGGFRFFHDHDARVLSQCLDDTGCAKIILTRNPLDSYVSRKIAAATGQWKLTNPTHQKAQQIEFDAGEFEAHVNGQQQFLLHIQNHLQTTGQTAFFLTYDDLQNLDVINGLGRFLGSQHQLHAFPKRLKKQNPGAAVDKIANPDQIEAALAKLDWFNLNRVPNFEPRRGPSVPRFVAAAQAPLLFMPIQTGLDATITGWLAKLDGVKRKDLLSQFSQKSLREWRLDNRGARSFTVVQHPVARSYHAFCKRIFPVGPGTFPGVRKTLRRVHNLPLPDGPVGPDFTVDDMRACFTAFLEFLRTNLAGQTSLRVDAAWASQSVAIQGFAEISPPDLVVRDDQLGDDLAYLAASVGWLPKDPAQGPAHNYPFALKDIYTDAIEVLAKSAYAKDYHMYGFRPWRLQQQGVF